MTKRELKKLAQKIAKLELIIQENKDKEQVIKAQRKINSLCEKLKTPDEMFYLDELIQEEIDSLT